MFKKGKKGQNIWKFGQKCKKNWKYFEKVPVIACDYCTQWTARKGPVYANYSINLGNSSEDFT